MGSNSLVHAIVNRRKRLPGRGSNGGEFNGDFLKAVGESQHVRIPPAAHTFQSDVETVHRLEEDEFFDPEDFSSRGNFLAKVHTYQLDDLSPWQIIERLAPRSPLEAQSTPTRIP